MVEEGNQLVVHIEGDDVGRVTLGKEIEDTDRNRERANRGEKGLDMGPKPSIEEERPEKIAKGEAHVGIMKQVQNMVNEEIKERKTRNQDQSKRPWKRTCVKAKVSEFISECTLSKRNNDEID